MDRASQSLVNRQPRTRAASVAAEWGRTFLAQSLIGILLAIVWTMLGLQ